MTRETTQRITNDLAIRLVWQSGVSVARLPADRFCVRKATAVYAQQRHWIYADAIPWDSPYWPASYGISIHAFSSPDAACWEWHGPVIDPGPAGAWDGGGVSTPGAVVWGGRVHVFYAGHSRADGRGTRWAGLAVADHPAGPFHKPSGPILKSEGHLDDYCPVLSRNAQGVDLYFREAMHHLPPPNYSVRLARNLAGDPSWSDPVEILGADSFVRAYETAEVKRSGDKVILSCFEHFADTGRFKTGVMWSEDGVHFTRCVDPYLDDGMLEGCPEPRCGLQWCLLSGPDGAYRHVGIAESVDAVGHYNLRILPLAAALPGWPVPL